MSQSGFEKIFAYRVILIRIFKNLNFMDQLILSQVNCVLRRVFETYIWSQKYRILEICNNCDNFVIMNETKTNLLNLNSDELKEFLRHYADGVQELIERRHWDSVLDIAVTFRNLTHLNLGKREIEQNPLDLVAENCAQLKSLRVYIQTSGDIGCNEILPTKSLLQMRHLKQLVLETDVNVVITLRQFRELITQLQLQSLVLAAIILLDESPITDMDEALTSSCVSLEELDVILANVCPELWLQNLTLCLGNCPNLQSLTLEIQRPTSINTEALNLICRLCDNLKKFIIHNSCIDARNFLIPPKVTELGFYSCRALTSENLKQILRQPNLNKLKSIYTQYQERRLTETLPPWPLIQSLACDEWSTYHMKHIFRANGALKELRWHKTVADDNDIARDGRLVGCINLETLEWYGTMPLETLEKLPNLHKLTISVAVGHIAPLLKLPTLVELCIRKTWREKGMEKPTLGFPSNVNVVQITRAIMLEAMDFWLDLLNQNPHMKLICAYDAKDFKAKDSFLKDIIVNIYFPKNLTTIDVWGCQTSCSALRVNFQQTILRIQSDTNPFRHPCNKDIHRIVLDRS